MKVNPPSTLIFLPKLFILWILVQPLWGMQVFPVRDLLYLIMRPICREDTHPTLWIIQESMAWCAFHRTLVPQDVKSYLTYPYIHTHTKEYSQIISRNAGSNKAKVFFPTGLLREFNMLMCTVSLHQEDIISFVTKHLLGLMCLLFRKILLHDVGDRCSHESSWGQPGDTPSKRSTESTIRPGNKRGQIRNIEQELPFIYSFLHTQCFFLSFF